MKNKINFRLMTIIAVGVIVLGGGVAAFSSPLIRPLSDKLKNNFSGIFSRTNDARNESDASIIVDVEEKDIAEEKPDLILGGKKKINNDNMAQNLPSLPENQVPWEQGSSNQTSDQKSNSGDNYNNKAPWQQGPSQQ